MIGHWTGSYTGMNKNLRVPTNIDSIAFDLYIESFDKNGFEGFVDDRIFQLTDRFGIQGHVKGKRITFQKYKTIGQGRSNELVSKEIDINGPIILYNGKLNNDKTAISGKWKFKLRIVFLFGFIPFPYRRATGTWSMKYSDIK